MWECDYALVGYFVDLQIVKGIDQLCPAAYLSEEEVKCDSPPPNYTTVAVGSRNFGFQKVGLQKSLYLFKMPCSPPENSLFKTPLIKLFFSFCKELTILSHADFF